MKNVTIECASGEERKVLAYIEKKYPNVEWRSGKRPTDVPDHYFYENGTLINVCQNRISCVSATEPNFYGDPVVTAEKFLEKDSKPSIVIFRRDRNVIAKNVATGDEGIAKCSPDDEFCFKTGASIALARLMAKTPEKEKPEAKFKVGDYVTLREGIASGKKYGALTLHSGCMYGYANGKRLEVEGVKFCEDDGMYHYRCKAADRNYFYYTEAMLDKWDESKIYEGDRVRIKKGCTGNRFDLYYEWVKEHISDPDLLLAFERGDHIDTSLDYEVVKIAPHEAQPRTLAYIKYKDDCLTLCYLFNIEALEKV